MSKKAAVAAVGIAVAVGAAVGMTARGDRKGDDVRGSAARKPLLLEDVDVERFVDALSEAISYRTVVLDDGTYDADEFDALQAMLARRYPRLHARLEREAFKGHGLLYTWAGSDPELDPIVLMAHQDVVPVEEGTEDDWVVAPFRGAVVDGKLYGRGSADMKCVLISLFEVIEYLLERDVTPRRTVLVVSGHDEEAGGANGARVIAEQLRAKGVRPWFVVDEGGMVTEGMLPSVEAPIALVGITEKGYANVRLTARGDGRVSSIAPPGTTIAQLAVAIARLEANPLPARTEPMMPTISALAEHLPGVLRALASRPTVVAPLLSRLFARDPHLDAVQRTTMVPTIVSGGVKANVVPQSASVVFNVRVIPGDTIATVVKHIEHVVGHDIEVEVLPDLVKEPSPLSRVGSEAWETLVGVVREVFPEAIVAPHVLVGASDSRYFEGTAGDVYRFIPFVFGASEMDGIHGTDEFVRVGDVQRAVTFYARLIAVAAGAALPSQGLAATG